MRSVFNCLYCGETKKLEKNTFGKYCSNACQGKQKRANYIDEWKRGVRKGHVGKTLTISRPVRFYIFDKFKNRCCKCGWAKINEKTKSIPLQVNHIDGNAENCLEENLELLCPNCHSLTSNFGNLNRGNGRRKR